MAIAASQVLHVCHGGIGAETTERREQRGTMSV